MTTDVFSNGDGARTLRMTWSLHGNELVVDVVETSVATGAVLKRAQTRMKKG